ncbi:hypothetical protein CP8484711_0599A, partial [Chlamydia psittaci 84-8471/1]
MKVGVDTSALDFSSSFFSSATGAVA